MTTCVTCVLFDNGHSDRCEVLICIFLMISHVEHLFICLLLICISHWKKKMSIQFFCTTPHPTFFGCPATYGHLEPVVQLDHSCDLCHRCDLCHCCGDPGSLTSSARPGITPASWRSRDSVDPVVSLWELLFCPFFNGVVLNITFRCTGNPAHSCGLLGFIAVVWNWT